MLQNWRFWVLTALMIVPPAIYIALGAAWLAMHGWLLVGFLTWTASALAFSFLSVRWTKSTRTPSIAPLDWNAPETFAPRDHQAWAIVQEEAEEADRVSITELTSSDLYIRTGLQIARRLSETYDPGAETPLEHVPIAELLTAFELAAEDLNLMIREIPGGDLATFAHGKAAVQAANVVAKANEYYNYLLPLFQPVQGILRLGTSKLMTQPAWRNMQQNVLRWFYKAYVQRVGIHLIEMYSGRLSIGATEYRRLTGRATGSSGAPGASEQDPGVSLAICGARGAGKTTLLTVLEGLRSTKTRVLEERLTKHRLDPGLALPLSRTTFTETESYGTRGDRNSFLDRLARQRALSHASHADLLVLVVDASRAEFQADARFVQEWLDYYKKKPGLQRPPALVVMTGIDRLNTTEVPQRSETIADPAKVRQQITQFLEAIPQELNAKVVTLNLANPQPEELDEVLFPALASLVSQSARGALIRHFHEHASRSKAGRFLKQVGKQGQKLWNQAPLASWKKTKSPNPPAHEQQA